MTHLEYIKAKISFHQKTGENLQAMYNACLPDLLHLRPMLKTLAVYHLGKANLMAQIDGSITTQAQGLAP